jgi:hypothetical protein
MELDSTMQNSSLELLFKAAFTGICFHIVEYPGKAL